MNPGYCSTFAELIRTPFQHISLLWGIVPLYVVLLVSEMTPARADFRTAIQTGFSFLWAAAQWLYPLFAPHGSHDGGIPWHAFWRLSMLVNLLVVWVGVVALYSGLRCRYPKHCSFLGYTRFGNYFMILIYPLQAHRLAWTWHRLFVILLFALPVWLLLHFALMPLRGKK